MITVFLASFTTLFIDTWLCSERSYANKTAFG